MLVFTTTIWAALMAVSEPAFTQHHIALTGGKSPAMLLVQLADDEAERAYGLMNRTEIAPFQGMLFDFVNPYPVRMWMKDTPMPLDMLFFDADRRLIYLQENTTPFSLDPIGPDAPVRYVLELPAGAAAEYGVDFNSYFNWHATP